MEVENYPKWKDTKGRVITPKSEDQKSSSKKKDVSGVDALRPKKINTWFHGKDVADRSESLSDRFMTKKTTRSPNDQKISNSGKLVGSKLTMDVISIK